MALPDLHEDPLSTSQSDTRVNVTSPNLFSCESLADLPAFHPSSHEHDLDVLITSDGGLETGEDFNTQQSSSNGFGMCFADPISGLINQGSGEGTSDPGYLMVPSPLHVPLATCFDSPLPGPLNSNAYHLLD